MIRTVLSISFGVVIVASGTTAVANPQFCMIQGAGPPPQVPTMIMGVFEWNTHAWKEWRAHLESQYPGREMSGGCNDVTSIQEYKEIVADQIQHAGSAVVDWHPVARSPAQTIASTSFPPKPSLSAEAPAAPPAAATASTAPSNHPELNAKGCLIPEAGESGAHGFRNHCKYTVSYNFCYALEADTQFPCGRNSGSNSVAESGWTIMPMGAINPTRIQATHVRFMTCKGSLGDVEPKLTRFAPVKGMCIK